MAEAIKVTGLEDCFKCLDRMPANAFKMSRKAMTEGSKVVAKQLRSAIPKRWRSMIRYRVGKTATDNLTASIGLFNRHQRKGKQGSTPVDDWFKAYWSNYGTLQYRDASHQFKYPVKKKSKSRRNDVGQRPQHFFEASTSGWELRFKDGFESGMQKNESMLYDR